MKSTKTKKSTKNARQVDVRKKVKYNSVRIEEKQIEFVQVISIDTNKVSLSEF